MPHPGTQELAKRMQSVPRTSRGLQTLLPEVRALRNTLIAQNDESGLLDLAEKVRLWAPGEKAPAVTARALAEAADVLADADQWERATQLLERAMQASPLDLSVLDKAQAVLTRGKAYEELHDLLTDHAHTLDRKFVDEAQVRASVWQRVGKVRAEKLRNLDAAIVAYDTAVNIQPEVSSVRELALLLESRGTTDDKDSAADLYCLLGELVEGDESALYYARALHLKPDHPDALAQLRDTPQPSLKSRTVPVDDGHGFRDVTEPRPTPQPVVNESQFAATVLQFPQGSPRPSVMPLRGSTPPPVKPTASAHGLPPPAIRPMPAGLPPMAGQAPGGFGQPLGTPSRQSVSELSMMAKLPGGAFDDVRVSAASIPYPSDAPAPYRASPSQPPPLRRSSPPVQAAPSFAPDVPRYAPPPTQAAPTTAEDTWNEDRPKKRASRWILVSAAVVLLGAGGTFAVKPELLDHLAKQAGVASTVTGAASGNEGRVEIPTPAVSPTPAPEPAVAPVAAAASEPKAEPPKVEAPKAEPEKPAEQEKALRVSVEKGSLRAKGGKFPKNGPSLHEALQLAVAALDACYGKALGKKPKLQGSMTFSWVVKPTGKVDKVKKESDTLKDAPLAACALKAVKQAEFEKPKGGPVKMRGAFEFAK